MRSVYGDSDPMVPSANAKVFTLQLPNASVLVFPDSGHGVAFQHFRAFVAVARDFLRS